MILCVTLFIRFSHNVVTVDTVVELCVHVLRAESAEDKTAS